MSYHNLKVYQKAYSLALVVHKLTLQFPRVEQYELANQLRRSTKSIPVNIAEGMGRQESKADVKHFIRIAIGSCDETRVWLEFTRDLGYMSEERSQFLDNSYQEIGRMLRGIIKHYNS